MVISFFCPWPPSEEAIDGLFLPIRSGLRGYKLEVLRARCPVRWAHRGPAFSSGETPKAERGGSQSLPNRRAFKKEMVIDVDTRVTYVKIYTRSSRSMMPMPFFLGLYPYFQLHPCFRVKNHLGFSRLSIVLHGSWIYSVSPHRPVSLDATRKKWVDFEGSLACMQMTAISSFRAVLFWRCRMAR